MPERAPRQDSGHGGRAKLRRLPQPPVRKESHEFACRLPPPAQPSALSRGHKKVIFASSLGTVFEWYDFYLYGSLAAIIAKQFFSGLNDTSAFIFALLAFAAGFAVRPFGALVFGRLGDWSGASTPS
jgi:hypothetical protein